MDERLLLLPTRNRHAQFAAASDSARGDWLEKTTVRAADDNDRHREDRQLAKASSTSGGITRSGCRTGEVDAGRPIVAQEVIRQPDRARTRQARVNRAAWRSGR